MPVRATKRGAERTPLSGDYDVLVCGASFAGLAVARELRGTGARVLVLDRYEIGERQTSACAAPTEWLRNLGLEALDPPDVRVAGRPYPARARALAAAVDVLHVRLPAAVRPAVGSSAAPGRSSRRPRSRAATGDVVHTDRGDVRAPLIVDALGWKRASAPARAAAERAALARPGGPSRRHRRGPRAVDRQARHPRRLRLVVPRARRGARRRRLVRPARPRQGSDRRARRRPRPAARRLPGQLDPPPPAPRRRGRRVLRRRLRRPLPAADRRGHPHGVLLRHRAAGASCARCSRAGRSREDALARYAAFSAAHRWKYECMLEVQHLCRAAAAAAGRHGARVRAPRVAHWSFGHYLEIAPPSFALPAPPAAVGSVAAAVAA